MVLGASLELETPGAASVSAVGSDGLVGLEHQSTPVYTSTPEYTSTLLHHCNSTPTH